MITLEQFKKEIDDIYDNNPEKRDKYVFVFTPETKLESEDIYHVAFIDNDISDRIDINVTCPTES